MDNNAWCMVVDRVRAHTHLSIPSPCPQPQQTLSPAPAAPAPPPSSSSPTPALEAQPQPPPLNKDKDKDTPTPAVTPTATATTPEGKPGQQLTTTTTSTNTNTNTMRGELRSHLVTAASDFTKLEKACNSRRLGTQFLSSMRNYVEDAEARSFSAFLEFEGPFIPQSNIRQQSSLIEFMDSQVLNLFPQVLSQPIYPQQNSVKLSHPEVQKMLSSIIDRVPQYYQLQNRFEIRKIPRSAVDPTIATLHVVLPRVMRVVVVLEDYSLCSNYPLISRVAAFSLHEEPSTTSASHYEEFRNISAAANEAIVANRNRVDQFITFFLWLANCTVFGKCRTCDTWLGTNGVLLPPTQQSVIAQQLSFSHHIHCPTPQPALQQQQQNQQHTHQQTQPSQPQPQPQHNNILGSNAQQFQHRQQQLQQMQMQRQQQSGKYTDNTFG